MSFRRVVGACASALCFALGCTSVLGIDGEYSLIADGGSSEPSTGGRSEGGAGASGGDAANGGMPIAEGGKGGAGSGGSDAGAPGNGGTAAGGVDGGSACEPGKKRCAVNGESLCVAPDPSVGCGPTGCEQCMPPQGGYGLCKAEQCSFGCFEGFVEKGAACEPIPPPDGGGGGGTGTGGNPGSCSKNSDCPACGSALGCCSLIPSGRCGCNFVWCVASP